MEVHFRSTITHLIAVFVCYYMGVLVSESAIGVLFGMLIRVLVVAGYNEVLGDVFVGRFETNTAADMAYISWEPTEVRGSTPRERYGHTMVTLPHNGLMVMFGGRNDEINANGKVGAALIAEVY